jgi:hypothetical protein
MRSALGFVPKKIAHFGYARVETMLQVHALCSPADQFTQYWIKKPNGERFWATLKDLKPLPWIVAFR